MRNRLRLFTKLKNDRGVTAIVVAIVSVMLFGFAALAVDIGFGVVARNELHNVADAAALAATRELGVIYQQLTYLEQQSYVVYTDDETLIKNAAKDVALKNKAGGSNIIINDADIIIGRWVPERKNLDPPQDPLDHPRLDQPDAVRVIARRDGNANDPITTFFAKILGKDNLNVAARATAALTGQSTEGPGKLPLPMGISKRWFENPTFCGSSIRFYPTCSKEPCDALGCSGWHTYTESPSSAATLRDILIGLKDRTYISPEATAGETQFDFTGGSLASVFDDMKALYDYMKTRDDDGDDTKWTTTVVVYDWPDCTNPNILITITGFTTVVIDSVLVTPEKTILGRVLCDNKKPGRGGGGYYGTKGTIPGLVQ
jgi:hypothetical protein